MALVNSLFILHLDININDIHHNVLDSECSLYANDALLSCDVAGDISSLQAYIDVLVEWSVAWVLLSFPPPLPEVCTRLDWKICP